MHLTSDKARVFLALTLLWLLGLYLRLPILVIPPLAPFINADFQLSQTLLGSLTTLPVLMLSLGALIGSLAIMRLGARNSLALALALVATTSAARGLTDSLTLLILLTLLMGLGIAIMQPSLPALLPRWLDGKKLALGTAVYMNGMLMGEFLGAGVTLPVLMPLLEGSWRATLIAWSLPAFLVVIATFLPRQREDTSSHDKVDEVHWLPDWKDPFLWRIGLLLASSASLFFGTNAYLGSLLEERGEMQRLEAAFFWFNLAQVAASLAMLALAERWVARRGPLILSTLCSLLGMLGLLLTSGWISLVFAFLLSFWAGILLILLVALPPQLLPGKQAGRLAAGAFTLAYSLSFFVPLLGGSLADWTGQPSHALWLLFVLSLPALWLAWRFPLKH
ncbi:MFS transporter, CP family, cyanate transporter [Marinospirillum celere]|uniref:MFS transporter, CP family, cyanate transporter n=1 Tax=Marinospirillum celere TaxID=1122252 RepID=A0A1I1H9N1_9GAMM|nr:MFS transporter [Marinospirillum celere]SFC17830.1 MFS transporter, CP family, cyanate transporter [Marinospirillum celere]